MVPAPDIAVLVPPHKRQSDCPILFPTDCGDGYCCGALSTCVQSSDGTRCALSGGPVDVPARPGGTTPSPTLSSSTSSTTSRPTSTPSPTTQASTATQTSQQSMGSGQVAGVAIGSSVGGIMVILLIISALMWYHRRKPQSEQDHPGFNPATDSVSAMVDSPGGPGSNVVSMYDPAAWRENYSAASPRELDGRPSVQQLGPRHAGSIDAGLRGGGVGGGGSGTPSIVSPVGTVVSSPHGRVSYSSSGSSSRTSRDGLLGGGDLPPAYARRTSARGTPIAELE